MSFSETSKTVALGTFVVVNDVELGTGYPLFAPYGSVTAPSYSFASQTGSGLFLTSNNDLSVGASWAASPSGNTTLGGPAPATYNGGEGVTFIPQVTTLPTIAPNGGSGGLLFVDGISLNYMDSTGTITDMISLVGDLNGPGSSTDERGVRFNGTTGKLVQNSTLHIDSANNSILLNETNGAGTPSYSFVADTTTGMYRAGADALGFSTQGVQRMRVNTSDVTFTTPIRMPTGSVSNPGMRVSAGGMFPSTSGALFMESAGVVGLTITPNNVAVGGGAPVNYAGGLGVLLLHEVTTAPTSATTGGVALYTQGDAVKVMTTASATPITLTECVEGPASSTDTAPVRFDGTTGDVVKSTSLVLIGGSGRVGVVDGSAALPALTFSGDTTTGVYWNGGSITRIATAGVERLSMSAGSGITSSNRFRYADGTAAAPGVRFTGDTDSGLYLEGGSSVGVTAGTAPGLVLSPSTNVSFAGGEAASYGAGAGVVFINQATTNPSTNPTTAGLLYVPSGDVNSLAYRDTAGTVTVITSRLDAPASSTDRAVVRWDGVSGRRIQNSSITVSAAGEMLGPDGAVSAPTYSFVGDTNTGMYLSAPDTLQLALGGANVLSVSATSVQSAKVVHVPDGVLASPVITFTSDTNTGLFRSGADTVQLVAGGVAAMTLTFPAATLHPNVTLGSTNVDYGGGTAGQRVVLIEDVTVAPSGTASAGGRVYVSGTTLNYHDHVGAIVDLANTAAGPGTATVANTISRYDGAGGGTVQGSGILIAGTGTAVQPPTATAAAPTFAFNASTTTGLYFPTTTSIALATAGVDRLTMSSAAVTVPTQDMHADAGMEIGGAASGVSYALSGAALVANAQDAAGSFAWSNSGGTIMTTSGTNLSINNKLIRPEADATFEIGHDGTNFDFASNSTGTLKDVVISVGGTDLIDMDTNDVEIDVDLVTPGRFSSRKPSRDTAFYDFSGGASTTRGFIQTPGGAGFMLGFASGQAFSVLPNATVGFGGSSSDNFNHVMVWGNGVASNPAGAGRIEMSMRAKELTVTTPSGSSVFCGGSTRGKAILSSLSVVTATSTNTDGLTWTSIDGYGVAGLTTGEMVVDEGPSFVTFTATASWASNSTGHRRLSIMLKTAGPTYTRLNGVISMAVNGAVTAQTVSFFGSVDPATDALTVQVEQTSGGNLAVDLSATLVRYTINV